MQELLVANSFHYNIIENQEAISKRRRSTLVTLSVSLMDTKLPRSKSQRGWRGDHNTMTQVVYLINESYSNITVSIYVSKCRVVILSIYRCICFTGNTVDDLIVQHCSWCFSLLTVFKILSKSCIYIEKPWHIIVATTAILKVYCNSFECQCWQYL